MRTVAARTEAMISPRLRLGSVGRGGGRLRSARRGENAVSLQGVVDVLGDLSGDEGIEGGEDADDRWLTGVSTSLARSIDPEASNDRFSLVDVRPLGFDCLE